MRCIIFGLLALRILGAAVFAVQAGGRDEQKVLRPAVEWHGQLSGIAVPKYVRITTGPEWMSLWRGHIGDSASPATSDALRPGINFDDYMVVGIFTGKQLGKGGVVLASITDEGGLIRLRFEHTLAATRDRQEVLPYGIVVLPRSPKPIVIEENVSNFGQQAVWKQRQRLPGLRG
jgi:hypothetical protein